MQKPIALKKLISAINSEKKAILMRSTQGLKYKAVLNPKRIDFNKAKRDSEFLTEIIDILDEDIEKSLENGRIFGGFSDLCLACEFAQLNAHEKREIIFYFIEKNLRMGILSSASSLYKDSPFFRKLEELDDEDIKKIQTNSNLNCFLSAQNDELPKELREKQIIIINLLHETDKEFYNFIKAYHTLKYRYFEKFPNLTEEDINEVKIALYFLGVYVDTLEDIESDIKKDIIAKENVNDKYLKRMGRILLNDLLINGFEKFATIGNVHTLGILYTLDKWQSKAKSKSKILFLGSLNYNLPKTALTDAEIIEFILGIIEHNLNGSTIDFDLDCGKFNLNEVNNDSEVSPVSYKALLQLFDQNINFLMHLTFMPNDIDEIKSYYRLLKEHYVLKKDNFDINDIEYICYALSKLGLNHKYVTLIKNYLMENLKNRQVQPKAILRESTLSQKERNSIEHELSSYLNIYTLKPIKYLTNAELIYIINLLGKLNYTNKQIFEFIKAVYKFNKGEDILPIDEFLDLHDKIEYFSKWIPELKDILIDLDNACNEFAENNVDEDFYQAYVNDGLNKAKEIIPQCFSYEFHKLNRKK